ncbi:MAG: cobalamin-dependent protein [Spirochaetales bacterium]|nr:cobalamin-dependent protein [Spirochaetales bacterium]
MGALLGCKDRRERVLLVYFGQILDGGADTCMPMAPIGLFMINGCVKESGYTIKILHVLIAKNNEIKLHSDDYKDSLKKEITRFKPDFVGFSFRNMLGVVVNPALHHALAERNKNLLAICSVFIEKEYIGYFRSLTAAPFIGGGSAFSIAPKLHMKHLGLDYGFVGEGEESFLELVDHLDSEKPVDGIAGLAYHQNGDVITHENRFIADLSEHPPMDIGEFKRYRRLF